MRTTIFAIIFSAFVLVCLGGCRPAPPPSAKVQSATRPQADVPSALPDNAFKADITLLDVPPKLRAGQKETIRLKIRNGSDVMWWSRGAQINTRSDNKFYLAAGNRWLKPDGSLLTNMDGRYGIPKDLAPGEETEVPLLITAPKEPGDYTLEVDLVQEQVAWFSDKGSPTAKTKITIVK
ncbi:MAG: hypothetical protein ABR607_03575 [Pyrinomonadaceae bacterium]